MNNAFCHASRLTGLQNSESKKLALALLNGATMNLTIWLPSTFALGFVLMAGCYLFLLACEKI
jgi:hypothetical protein